METKGWLVQIRDDRPQPSISHVQIVSAAKDRLSYRNYGQVVRQKLDEKNLLFEEVGPLKEFIKSHLKAEHERLTKQLAEVVKLMAPGTVLQVTEVPAEPVKLEGPLQLD